MIKTLFVLKHHSEDLYLQTPRPRKVTTDIQLAFRALTEVEANSWAANMPVSLAWKAIPVRYDTEQGKVVGLKP